MKAVVLEIKGDKAAVMTSDGCVRRIDNVHFNIGQQIIVSDIAEKTPILSKSAQKFMKIAAAAAAMLLVVARGTYIYSSPYGVVSLDVNPSIEYTINRLDKVLYVNGVNDDGKNILDNLDGDKLINMSIEKAVDITIDQIESEGYFAGEDRNYVVVAANTIQETHTDKLVNKLDGSLTNNQKVKPIAMKASDDDLTAAREKGTSPGKMMIVENLDSVSAESIDKDEWLGKSVADIVHEYNKCTGSNNTEEYNKPSEEQPSYENDSRPVNQCAASAKKAAKKIVAETSKDTSAASTTASTSKKSQSQTEQSKQSAAEAKDVTAVQETPAETLVAAAVPAEAAEADKSETKASGKENEGNKEPVKADEPVKTDEPIKITEPVIVGPTVTPATGDVPSEPANDPEQPGNGEETGEAGEEQPAVEESDIPAEEKPEDEEVQPAQEEQPAVEEAQPVPEEQPAVEEAQPAPEAAQPVVEEAQPEPEAAQPAIEETQPSSDDQPACESLSPEEPTQEQPVEETVQESEVCSE